MKIHIVNYNPSSFKNIHENKHLLVRQLDINEMYSETYGRQLIKHNKVYHV